MTLASFLSRRGVARKDNLRGFTLIELLVVIAIIGILSAVVLASLNTARSKGNDASVKANLDTIRTQSAIYYDTNSNYYTGTAPGALTACTTANTLFTDPQVTAAIAGANTAGGVVACANTASMAAWAVHGQVSNPSAGEWCVDSTGVSKFEGTRAPTGTSCPEFLSLRCYLRSKKLPHAGAFCYTASEVAPQIFYVLLHIYIFCFRSSARKFYWSDSRKNLYGSIVASWAVPM